MPQKSCPFLCCTWMIGALIALTTLTGCSKNEDDKEDIAGKEKHEQRFELFVTTKNGDVKKSAGTKLHYTQLDKDIAETANKTLKNIYKMFGERESYFQQILKSNPQAANDTTGWPYINLVNNNFRKYCDEVIEPKIDAEVKKFFDFLISKSESDITDSDGRVTIALPPGDYFIWTDVGAVNNEKYAWYMIIKVNKESKHILGSDQVNTFKKSIYSGVLPVKIHSLYQFVAILDTLGIKHKLTK